MSTPKELEEAILLGRSHIVVTAHLDLTDLPQRETSICLEGCASPLPEIRETMSIQVSLMLARQYTTPREATAARSQ